MEPKFIDRSISKSRTFSVTETHKDSFLDVWHYHEQVEIVAILKSTGTRFVGNSIAAFEPGEVVLLGENVPHMWKNNISKSEKAMAIAIHLEPSFIKHLNEIPEVSKCSFPFQEKIRGAVYLDQELINKFMKINASNTAFRQYIYILELLQMLSDSPYHIVDDSAFSLPGSGKDWNRREKIRSFIMNNFRDDISLGLIANEIGMNNSAFSRYFSNEFGISLIQYINNIRIAYAQRLILNRTNTISNICFQSGFRNISNFNRLFKRYTGFSPVEYRNEMEKAR